MILIYGIHSNTIISTIKNSRWLLVRIAYFQKRFSWFWPVCNIEMQKKEQFK